VFVTLTEADLALADEVGRARAIEVTERGRRDRGMWAVTQAENEAVHILGVRGEIAVAWALGFTDFQPSATFRFGAPDVGPYHVRATYHDPGALIIRPNDPDDRIYISVCLATCPVARLTGWAWGREAKRPQFLKGPNGKAPAWFVPFWVLRPMRIFPT
jgi:hypothetical protein